MKKAYMFRIYPNKNQDVILNRTLSTCRHLYNNSLAERKKQAELNRLKKSLTNFFKGFGYPRFKGRNRYNSFTYPQNGFSIKDGKLHLSKIGNIKIILHQEIEGKIKTCTIKKDFAHKLSRNLVDTYDSIKFEDLQIKNMVQNHRLAKSINDAGWYQLMQFTKYKAEYAGKLVEFVNPAGTSQTCICGFHVPKSLSVRIHSCPSCGFIMGRDQVSAILIENKPISTVGTTGINARQGYLSRVSMQRDAPWL
jgi:IS605 OrfB family transposase